MIVALAIPQPEVINVTMSMGKVSFCNAQSS
jgi:hypothetical protein